MKLFLSKNAAKVNLVGSAALFNFWQKDLI